MLLEIVLNAGSVVLKGAANDGMLAHFMVRL